MFVFQSARHLGHPLLNIHKPLARLMASTGANFRVHDLRRTAATGMAQIGIRAWSSRRYSTIARVA